jgi:PKD repeat protein
MQKIIFLFTALLMQGYYILEAQQKYFERTYLVQDISAVRKIFFNQDGTYTIIGNSAISNPNVVWFPYYLRLNEFGDTLMLKQFVNEEISTEVWDAVETQYGYALSSSECQPQTDPSVGCKTRAHLMRISHTGELLDLSLAGNDTINQSVGRAILQTPDNGYIMAGLIIPTTGSLNKLYLVKLNADGSTEWEKMYDYFQYHNSFRGILPAPEGGYYALASIRRGAYFPPFPEPWYYTGDILLYKLDELGNIEWQEIYFEEGEHEQSTTFCMAPDGSLFIGGSRDYTDLVVKLDTAHNVMWEINETENECGSSLVSITSDGDFLVSGCTYTPPSYGNAFVKKISPTGNILWNRIYGDAWHDYFYTHRILPDGSILLGGRNDMSSSAEVYVVKTNCMGLVTPLPQASFSWQANELNPIALQFNNYSQYVYADSIDGGKYIWDWGDGSPPVTFTSESFQEVFHNYPAPSSYTVTLTAIVCQDTSMVQATIETLSGAGGTVGLAPNLPPDPLKGEMPLIVYPNPAQNTLTFQRVSKSPSGDLGVTEGRWAGDIEITLLTLTGQSILKTTLPAGETNKTISVAHLPVGLYLYMVSGGSVISGGTDNGNYGGNGGGAVLARGKVAVVR